MSYELRLEIEENSAEDLRIRLVAKEKQVSLEEAAMILLAARAPKRRKAEPRGVN